MKLENIGFYTLSDNRVKNASYNSEIKRIEFIITDKCNFKCPYCRGVRKDCQGEMSLGFIYRTIHKLLPIENIRFSGGEPTLYKYLPNIIAEAKKCGIRRIAISTNGSADLDYYKMLIYYGVNDFSISLDACCAAKGQEMAGVKGLWEKTIKNIEELSKLTYVTVGMVFTPQNIKDAKKSVEFAHNLGVSDIRVISSAQYNQVLDNLSNINSNIRENYPILNYRLNNFEKRLNVRGIGELDYHRCPLVLDDLAIGGNYHFPCIIYLREKGEPIGTIISKKDTAIIRKERYEWFLNHNTHKDKICKNNCLDVCVAYNNSFRNFHLKNSLPKLDSSLFEWYLWRAGNIHDLIPGQCRFDNIIRYGDLLKKYAIGWCESEKINCRPKEQHITLMCSKEEKNFWFHLRTNEFAEVFGIDI